METRISQQAEILERLSRVLTLLGFALALVASLAAPLLALSWSHQPFPGFLVEQTLVVNGISSADWHGSPAGLQYPQRVTRLGGVAVAGSADLAAELAAHAVGDQIPILTTAPDGSARLFPSVTLTAFPALDMVRLFWLPYLVGLVYLAIGLWIYRVQGTTRPGRALAYFCANTAIVCLLLFDLSTTHAGSLIWTVAVAQIGGALITLGMRFPVEWKPVERQPWLLAVPYGASIALAGWGVLVVNNVARPWDYIAAWGASYRYAAVGILAFLGMMFYRTRAAESPLVRRQARIVLWGSVLAFVPVSVWFLAPIFQLPFAFNAALLLPALLIFPVSLAVAILRYRLLEADALVNRTVVYGALMAILAGVFTALVGVSQRLFVTFTGERSDAAVVLTTLVVASAFSPIKQRLEGLVATRVKQMPDNTRNLKEFGEQVRAFTRMTDAEQITGRLLEEAARGLQAQSGAIRLVNGSRLETVHTFGRWTGEAWLSVPLEHDGVRYGLLFLGPRANHEPYRREDLYLVRQVGIEVTRALRFARAANGAGAVYGGDNEQPSKPATGAKAAVG